MQQATNNNNNKQQPPETPGPFIPYRLFLWDAVLRILSSNTDLCTPYGQSQLPLMILFCNISIISVYCGVLRATRMSTANEMYCIKSTTNINCRTTTTINNTTTASGNNNCRSPSISISIYKYLTVSDNIYRHIYCQIPLDIIRYCQILLAKPNIDIYKYLFISNSI